jgi:hypothetical protein
VKRKASADRPVRVDLGRKRQCAKHKVDRRRHVQAMDSDTLSGTDVPLLAKRVNRSHKADKRKQDTSSSDTDSDPDTTRRAKRTDSKHKADKREAPAEDGGSGTGTDTGSNTKRTCYKKKADTRRRNGPRGAASGCKAKNNDTAAGSYDDDDDDQHSTPRPTARQLRASIRTQRKDCISDLEPD